MGKSRDLSEFERGMIVGVRSSGRSVSETANMLGFSRTAVSRVYREWCDQKKTSSNRHSGGRKRLVDDSGEKRLEQLVEENNQATCEEIQALYNSGAEKPISHTTTRRTLKRLGYTARSPRKDDVTLTLAGLEALAAFTSGPEKLESSTEPVCSNKDEPVTIIQALTDSVSSNGKELDSTSPSSADSVQ